MTCIHRVPTSAVATGIGGGRTTIASVKCAIKQSSPDAKIELCQIDLDLGLSSMLNDSCLFNSSNEHLCPRRA